MDGDSVKETILGDFGEDLFSGTRSRVRAVNTEGYVAKRDDPLWFLDPSKRTSAEEHRKALKVKLDHFYYVRDWQAVVDLSTEMLIAETKKENSFRKELIETKARALMNLKKHAEAAQLLDDQREEFHCSDLELVYCFMRGTCALELGKEDQATSYLWRVVGINAEHVACWMKLTEVLMSLKDRSELVSELALLCALRLRAILARISAFPGRQSGDKAIADLAAQGVRDREGLAHDWCERARQSKWDMEELQLITKCIATKTADDAPAEDINPTVL